MKITQQTSSVLAINSYSSGALVGIFLFGLAFVGSGSFVISRGKLAVLSCSRLSPEPPVCTLEEKQLWGSRRSELGVLQGAQLQENWGDEASTYAVLIQSSSGTRQLNVATSNYGFHRQAVSQINQFVDHPAQPNLRIQQDQRLLMTLFGGVFLVSGLFIWLFVISFSWFEFDKIRGTLRVRTVSALQNKVIEYQLRDIRKVVIEESTDSDGDPVFGVSLIVLNQPKIELFKHKTAGIQEKEALANTIHAFLGLRV